MIEIVKFDNEKLINELQTLFSEVYKHNNELKNEYVNNPYTRVFIYCENNIIMGLIHINDIYDRYEINNIYVLDEYRHRGVASKLMDEVIELGKRSNIKNITLEVRVDNNPAINLYKKKGFVAKSTRKGYYSGIDGILMEKEMM